MAVWAKIKFFWETMLGETGSTLSATSTASGYNVSNLYNMLEVNSWKLNSTTSPANITFDAGNLLTNPGFETGSTTGWTGGSGGSVSNAQAHSGTYSYKIEVAGNPSNYYTPYQNIAVDLSQVYRLSAWHKVTSFTAGTLYVYFSAWTKGGEYISTIKLTGFSGGGISGNWEEVSTLVGPAGSGADYELPANTAYVRAQCFWNAGSTGTAYCDDFTVAPVYSADYLAIMGHNLATIGATLSLYNSNDGFVSDSRIVHAVKPGSDSTLLQEFRILVNGDLNAWPVAASMPVAWLSSGGIVARNLTICPGYTMFEFTRTGSNCYNYEKLPLYLRGEILTFGMWVYSTTPNLARVMITDDGVGTSFSSYHPGDGVLRFLTVTRQTNNAANYSYAGPHLANTDATAYFGRAALKVGSTLLGTDESDLLEANSDYKKDWKLRIESEEGAAFSSAPQMDICIWGNKTELDYVTASFDPHAYEEEANVNKSYGGYVTGVTLHHVERHMALQFEDCDSTLYAKLADWYDNHGLNNFFVAWENSNSPDDIYLMRREPGRNNPLKNGGAYRSVSIKLKGRKE